MTVGNRCATVMWPDLAKTFNGSSRSKPLEKFLVLRDIRTLPSLTDFTVTRHASGQVLRLAFKEQLTDSVWSGHPANRSSLGLLLATPDKGEVTSWRNNPLGTLTPAANSCATVFIFP